MNTRNRYAFMCITLRHFVIKYLLKQGNITSTVTLKHRIET